MLLDVGLFRFTCGVGANDAATRLYTKTADCLFSDFGVSTVSPTRSLQHRSRSSNESIAAAMREQSEWRR